MGLGIKIPKNALAAGRKAFEANPNGDFNNEPLPPGTYLGVVSKMKGVDTGKGPQIVLELTTGGECEPELKGRKVSLWFSFDEERVVYLFRALAMFGHDVSELDDKKLEAISKEINKGEIVVRFKAKLSNDGENTNYRINKVMTELSAEEVLAGEGAADDTDGSASDGSAEPGAGTDKGKKGKKKEDEPEPEAEGEEVDLDSMDRTELKAFISEKELDITVTKKMEDDEIREAIKEKIAESAEGSEAEPEAEAEPEEKPKKGGKKKNVEEEAEAEPEAEETPVLAVGTKVSMNIAGKTHKGTVIEILADEDKARVKSKTDGKIYKISPEKLDAAE